MRKAWGDFRRVRVLGDCGLTFGDWLRNVWKVARALRKAGSGPRERGLTSAEVPTQLIERTGTSALLAERRSTKAPRPRM
jgi:hypothetical protein